MPTISVVIPVYKAQNCLHELHRRLTASLESISADFEIVLVEDCGGDASWQIISELAAVDHRIKGMQLSRNFGQHYAITAGLDHCRGDWVVVMDCDLQDRPEEIPRLYAEALKGFDAVLALRAERQDSPMKRFFSWGFYKVFNYLSELDYDGRVGNFRIISRRMVDNFCKMREGLRFFGGLVTWMGFPTSSIEVTHDARFEGKSSYTFSRLWKLAFDSIVAHSDKPLRLSIRIGFWLSSLSFLYGLFIIYRALFHSIPITGWSSLIVSIYFLGGVIISLLGVLGIYIGKIFGEVKQRPLYLIREMTFTSQPLQPELPPLGQSRV